MEMPSTEGFNKLCQNNSAKIYSEKTLTGVSNVVYFRLCIILMHITPPVIAMGLMAPITRGMPNRVSITHKKVF